MYRVANAPWAPLWLFSAEKMALASLALAPKLAIARCRALIFVLSRLNSAILVGRRRLYLPSVSKMRTAKTEKTLAKI